MKPVYEARHGDCDGKPYVAGPGNQFGYYSGTLWPESRMQSYEQAELIAELVNEAYREGVLAAQREMRKSLGL